MRRTALLVTPCFLACLAASALAADSQVVGQGERQTREGFPPRCLLRPPGQDGPAGAGEKPTPGWAIVNLKAGRRYKGLNVFAGVKNLLDRHYTEYLSCLRDPFAAGVKVPEPGRTLYANVQYAF